MQAGEWDWQDRAGRPPEITHKGEGMTVTVEYREVYGTPLYYPRNITAQRLAAIAGKKTLSVETLCHALALGFTVEEVHGRALTNGYGQPLFTTAGGERPKVCVKCDAPIDRPELAPWEQERCANCGEG